MVSIYYIPIPTHFNLGFRMMISLNNAIFSIRMFTNCLQNLLNRRININNNYVPL